MTKGEYSNEDEEEHKAPLSLESSVEQAAIEIRVMDKVNRELKITVELHGKYAK